MRSVWGTVLLAWPLLAAGGAKAETPGGARLAMPFACVVERGRVRVQPAPEQIYEIADRADSQPFTACRNGPAGACRTFTIHRFTLSCPGGRAPWVEIVAAASAAAPAQAPRLELEDGRLLIGRVRPAGVGFMRDCYARLSGAGPRVRVYDPVLQDDCWSQQRRGVEARIELPLGYAPLGFARARLLPPARPAVALLPAPAPAPAPIPAPAAVRLADAASRDGGTVEASPAARFAMRALPAAASAASAGGSAAPEPAASGWRTDVVHETAAAEASKTPEPSTATPDAGALDAGATPSSWVAFAAVAAGAVGLPLVVWAVMVMLRRRRPARPAPPSVPAAAAGAAPTSARGTDGRAADSLKATAFELLPVIRERLDQLSPAMPLRQVLAREIHNATQRLDVLAAERPATPEEGRRNRGRLHTVVRDLQRLGEITEGARSSLGGHAIVPAELPEPRDKTEAYALLGVNADVNERIMKKLVEALRQSWHPDLARDDADRRRREDRIKQINIAWDLIQGKRVEA